MRRVNKVMVVAMLFGIRSASGIAQAHDLDTLITKNPFVTSAVGMSPVESKTTQLELRGVLVEGGVTWFNIYDISTKRAEWVRRGEAVATYLIQDFDKNKESLTLYAQGQTVTLAMREARSAFSSGSSRAFDSIAPTQEVPTQAYMNERPVLPIGKQLERVADEIRQRRQSRLQLANKG